MVGNLKVSTAELKNAASEFQNTGRSIRNLTNQMMTTVKSLTGQVWSGDAATAYVKKFNQLDDDMQRMQSMINEHVADLHNMAANYIDADKASMTSVSNLAEDVIV